MLTSLSDKKHKVNHRKTQSLLPSISLGELEKNLLTSKQKKKNGNKHSKQIHSTECFNNQIMVRSPFYDRTNCTNKVSCKCEYHKKRKLSVQKKFTLNKKFNIQQLNSVNRIQTVGNSQLIEKLKKGHKRFNSCTNEIQNAGKDNSEYFKNLIQNNKQLYQQFLKKLNFEQRSNLDCYNHQFQEFIKTNNQWILRQVNHHNTYFRNSNDHQADRTTNRFRTLPTNRRNSQSQSTCGQECRDRYLKLNIQDLKKNIRKKYKKNTQINFYQEDSQSSHRTHHFFSSFQNLNQNDRSKLQHFLQNAFKQIGLKYPDPKSQNSTQNPHFFQTICKNLMEADQNVVQKAKSLLRRVSRLPIQLYSTIMREMKMQMKSFGRKAQSMEKSVNLAFETIESSLESMMKNKEESKGKQKLSILGKIKSKIGGRKSLDFHPSFESKKHKVTTSSVDSNRSKQSNNRKISRFGIQKGFEGSIFVSKQGGQIGQVIIPQINQNKQQVDMERRRSSKGRIEQILEKQKLRQIKKGMNLRKIKKNSKLMKILEQQIQSDNKRIIQTKKLNTESDDQYLKQRAQSRKRMRQKEYKQHLEFLQMMKERENQRQQSTISEGQTKKNNTRAHYQRHKVFLKKIQMSLTNNQQLKEMIINYEDNLFTKKRKVRILKKIVKQCPNQQSQFCQDMKKYIEFYQKNMNMIVGKDQWGCFKKYTKKKGEIHQLQFINNQNLDIPFQMESLIQSIKTDNQLKFYNVRYVHFEEEDYDSRIKDLESYMGERFKNSLRHKNVDITLKYTTVELPNQRRSTLIQTGLDTKTYDKFQKLTDRQEEDQEKYITKPNELQSKELKKIVGRFNRNMSKFKKIFNLQNQQHQT